MRTASKRINIVDVLKPTDDVLGKNSTESYRMAYITDFYFTAEVIDAPKAVIEPPIKVPPKKEQIEASGDDETTNDSHATAAGQADSEPQAPISDISESVKWVLDKNFQKELIRLGISEDPVEWSV